MRVLFCCLFFFSMSCVCAGDSDNVTVVDFHVNDVSVAGLNTKGTFADLQNEINNAKYGSVLDLNRDYHANGGSTIQLDKDLIIDGHGHTLDCEKVCSAFHSVRGNFVLRNLNIINGYSKDCGGAVYVCGDTDRCPSFINCTFSNNEALNNGGAISNQGQRVILYSYEFSYYPIDVKNCKFINNVAKNSGGAIESMGTLTVYNSLFESNSAENNCGAISSIFNADIHDSSFYRNVAKDGSAGAVCSKRLYYLERCLFSENSADEDGGAVDVTTLEYANCTFKSNSAGEDGGAIYINDECWVTFSNCVFNNNHCGDEGGAIYLDSVSSHLTLVNNVFKGNNAGD